MQFQGRGTTYVTKRSNGVVAGPAIPLCQDLFTVSLKTDTFEHINKCGPVDQPDYRGTKSVSGEITLAYTDVADKKLALAVLGVATAAAGAPASITGEHLPAGLVAGDIYFLGGLSRHRTITSLVVKDSASPQATLAATTNYTLDAATGKVTIVNPGSFTQPLIAAYSHQDPASVSMLSAAQEEYLVNFEGINKANSNTPGSVELYRARFDPADNMDFLSDELQVMTLKGTVLADDTKLVTDTEFGQFGRRVGF